VLWIRLNETQQFDGVEDALKENPKAPVIWVLQKGMLTYWASGATIISELLKRFHRVQQFRIANSELGKEVLIRWASSGVNLSELLESSHQVQIRNLNVTDIVVVIDAESTTKMLMTLLSRLGIAVHLSGLEGEILTEVHKPDKTIIVGMPGRSIDRISNQAQSPLNLESMEIEKIIQDIVHSMSKPFSNKTRKNNTLLSDLILQYSRKPDEKNYARFIKAFKRSKLGVQISEETNENADTTPSTDSNPTRLNSTTTPDGQSRILVFADWPVYNLRFGMQFNGLMDGEAILAVVTHNPHCAGIYINSVLSESGMAVSREAAISWLKIR